MSELLTAFPGERGLETLLAKLTLLLMIGWVVHAVLRRSHPQWRVWLWRAVTLAAPVLVLWSATLPQWTWELAILSPSSDPGPAASASAGLSLANKTDEASASIPANSTVVSPVTDGVQQASPGPAIYRPVVDSAASGHGISWADVPGIVWLLIALSLLVRIPIQGLHAHRLARRGTPAREDLAAAGLAAARELALGAHVEFRVCERLVSPFVTGIRRSVIVIPQSLLRTLDATQLRLVLLHELAHVRGRDLPWSIAVRVMQSLLWFHPLAWGIRRAHRQSCEAACDSLAAAADRGSYRQFLARIALWTREARIAAPAGALPVTADITWRLRQLARDDNVRPPDTARRAIALVVLAGAVASLSAANIALSASPPESLPADETVATVVEDSPDSAPTDEEPAAADEPREAPALSAAAVADLARLQGIWQAVGSEEEMEEGTARFLMSFDGTMLTTRGPIPLGGPRTIRLEADHDPKRMIVGEGDAQNVHLYRFQGDQLSLCFNREGGAPPVDFDSGTVVTLRRLIPGDQLAAVRKGLAFLGRAQADDGSFGSGELKGRVGITALCGMALANGGDLAPADANERIDRAVDYILSHQDERGFFKGPGGMLYDHGYAIWFLARLHRTDRYRDRLHIPLRRAIDLTVDSQHENGGWRYEPVHLARNSWTDLSNTTVQLRALAEARRQEFEIPEDCFRSGVECLTEHQNDSGEFRYMAAGGNGSFSCTAQALSVLKQLGVEDGPMHEKGWRAFREYIDGSREREPNWFLYSALFAIDALGAITDQPTIDWYQEVCRTLVDSQHHEGFWRSEYAIRDLEYGTALGCLILLPQSLLEP